MRRHRLGAVVLAGAIGGVLPAATASGDVTLRWTRDGTGHVPAVAIGDTGADGTPEVVLAGRGVGAIDEASLTTGRFAWANKWSGSPAGTRPGDTTSASEMELADLNGDGAVDVVAGADVGLFAIDGKTGQTLWTARDAERDESDTSVGAHEIAVADFSGDGVPDVAFAELLDEGVSVVDGRNGALLWSYDERPLAFVQDLAAGDVDGDGFLDVVLAGDTDVGPEILAVTGRGSAASKRGTAIWFQSFPAPTVPPAVGSNPGALAIGQIVAGASPEVVVGGSGAIAVLEGHTGAPVAQTSLAPGTAAGRVLPLQLDGDADLEIVAATVTTGAGLPQGDVRAFDRATASLSALWTVAAPSPIHRLATGDLDGQAGPEIYAGGGWQVFGGRDPAGDGFVISVVPGAGQPAVGFTRRLPEAASALATGTVFGQPSILAGQSGPLGDGSGVYALDPAGEVRWSFRTGGRIERLAAGDLDGDGTPEVVEAADDATVAVHDADGALRWRRRVPGKGSPDVMSAAVGELLPAAGREVVAGTWEYEEGVAPGRLHAFDAEGDPRWSRDVVVENTTEECEPLQFVAGTVDELDVRDVDEDGAEDVLMAASAPGLDFDCGVVGRFDGSGAVVWQKALPVGQNTSLATGDLDADGVTDLLVTKASVFDGGAVYGLDGATGNEMWRVETPGSMLWASFSERDPNAVAAGDITGTVRVLDPSTGAERFQVDPGSASWDGEWSHDADGDGVRDLLAAFHDTTFRMLSGRDGTTLWSSPTDGDPGFTVATLGGGDRRVVVGTLGQSTYSPASLFVLDATDGARLGAFPTNAPVLTLAPTDLDGDGGAEVLAAGGWQALAVSASGPAPAPAAPAPGGLEPTGEATPVAPAPVAPTPPLLLPGGVPAIAPRVRPAAVLARTQASRRALRTTGRIVPPAGTALREACRGGRVTVRATGPRLRATRRVRLRRDCTFAARIALGRRAARGRVRIRVRFDGNRRLAPRRARTHLVRLR